MSTVDPRLEELRRRWAVRPPTPDRARWQHEPLPEWLQKSPLLQQIDALPRLYAEGEPRLAWLLQANKLAWEGTAPAPGTLLVSWDPWLERHPEAMERIAARYHHLGEKGSEVPALRGWVDFCRDHTADRNREPVPILFSSGRLVFFFDCLFFPALLPAGRLDRHLLPVVVLREGPPVAAVPPPELWPSTMA